jgi:branched-chain amino acid transport system substrate-binding protein
VDIVLNKSNPRVHEFIENFKARYKKEPNLDAFLAYDEVQMLASLIKERGYNSLGIREGLLSMKDFHGLTGELTMMSNGDIAFNLGLKIIKEGKAVPYY